MTSYEIQTRHAGSWTNQCVGEINVFTDEADAESAIDDLRQIGPDWADAEYRVREIDLTDAGRAVGEALLRELGEDPAGLPDAIDQSPYPPEFIQQLNAAGEGDVTATLAIRRAWGLRALV